MSDSGGVDVKNDAPAEYVDRTRWSLHKSSRLNVICSRRRLSASGSSRGGAAARVIETTLISRKIILPYVRARACVDMTHAIIIVVGGRNDARKLDDEAARFLLATISPLSSSS